jgi:protein gp37
MGGLDSGWWFDRGVDVCGVVSGDSGASYAEAKVPFFFKQWGGMNKKKNGRELEGRTWDEMPLISHMCRR